MADLLNFPYLVIAHILGNALYDIVHVLTLIPATFYEAATGSFLGAIGGAWGIWWVGKRKEHQKTLADINYVLVMLSAHYQYLKSFKEVNYQWLESTESYATLTEKKFDTEAIIHKLSPYAHHHPKILFNTVTAIDRLQIIEGVIIDRNKFISELDMKNNTNLINLIKGSSDVLIKNTDENILNLEKLIPQIYEIGQAHLPKKLAKKLMLPAGLVKENTDCGFKQKLLQWWAQNGTAKGLRKQ